MGLFFSLSLSKPAYGSHRSDPCVQRLPFIVNQRRSATKAAQTSITKIKLIPLHAIDGHKQNISSSPPKSLRRNIISKMTIARPFFHFLTVIALHSSFSSFYSSSTRLPSHSLTSRPLSSLDLVVSSRQQMKLAELLQAHCISWMDNTPYPHCLLFFIPPCPLCSGTDGRNQFAQQITIILFRPITAHVFIHWCPCQCLG
jgi:hypothetical protein